MTRIVITISFACVNKVDKRYTNTHARRSFQTDPHANRTFRLNYQRLLLQITERVRDQASRAKRENIWPATATTTTCRHGVAESLVICVGKHQSLPSSGIQLENGARLNSRNKRRRCTCNDANAHSTTHTFISARVPSATIMQPPRYFQWYARYDFYSNATHVTKAEDGAVRGRGPRKERRKRK